MIGRGTRLCPDLFGPEEDKADFRIFDFCFNFDFFCENPQGIETGGSASLGTRLFRARVQLLDHVQRAPELDPDGGLRTAMTDTLYQEVAAMNRENFIVRLHLEVVERFQERDAWKNPSENDLDLLQREVAGLPSEIPTDDIESRLFDLTALRTPAVPKHSSLAGSRSSAAFLTAWKPFMQDWHNGTYLSYNPQLRMDHSSMSDSFSWISERSVKYIRISGIRLLTSRGVCFIYILDCGIFLRVSSKYTPLVKPQST